MGKSFAKASRIILQLWPSAVLMAPKSNPNYRTPSAITTGANGEMSQEIELTVWSVPQVAKKAIATARTNTCVNGHRGALRSATTLSIFFASIMNTLLPIAATRYQKAKAQYIVELMNVMTLVAGN